MGDFAWKAENPGALARKGNRDGMLAISLEPRGQLWQLLIPHPNGYDVIESVLGVRPQENRVVLSGNTEAPVTLIWARRDQYFVTASEHTISAVADQISRHAYLLDQGDGRGVLRLEGAARQLREALSYLLPLDMRSASFPPRYAAASEIDIMPVNIWCDPTSTEDNLVVFLSVFRSYVASLQHALTDAGFSLR